MIFLLFMSYISSSCYYLFLQFLRVSKTLINSLKMLVNFSNMLINYFILLFLCLFFFFSNLASNIDQEGIKTIKSNTSLIIILHKIKFLRVCKTLVNIWKTLVNSSKTLVSFNITLVNYFSSLFLCLFFIFKFCINY